MTGVGAAADSSRPTRSTRAQVPSGFHSRSIEPMAVTSRPLTVAIALAGQAHVATRLSSGCSLDTLHESQGVVHEWPWLRLTDAEPIV